jgi:hypothetical protein
VPQVILLADVIDIRAMLAGGIPLANRVVATIAAVLPCIWLLPIFWYYLW